MYFFLILKFFTFFHSTDLPETSIFKKKLTILIQWSGTKKYSLMLKTPLVGLGQRLTFVHTSVACKKISFSGYIRYNYYSRRFRVFVVRNCSWSRALFRSFNYTCRSSFLTISLDLSLPRIQSRRVQRVIAQQS